jgi:hypothetical protein
VSALTDEPGEPLVVRLRLEPETEEERALLGQRRAAEEGPARRLPEETGAERDGS